MKLARMFAVAVVSSIVGLVACSSDSSTGTTTSACAEAKKVTDDCDAKPKTADRRSR